MARANGVSVNNGNNGFLTATQVAKMVNSSVAWVYRKAQAGLIPHVRLGAMIRFPKEDIDKWIIAHKKGSIKI
jgi:excisionase family DNA binding protein